MGEVELEYLESEESNAELWDYKTKDKLFLSTSREVFSQLEEAEGKGIVLQVDPRELKLSALNPRQQTYDTKGTGELEKDILRTGRIKDPLIVRINPNGVPEIIDGGLRWRLAIIHGIPTIPVLVERLTDDEAILRIESSNKKVKHDLITRGEWYVDLLKKYGSQREIARILRINEKMVRNCSALSTLPEISKKAIREGKMSWLIALDIIEETKLYCNERQLQPERIRCTEKYLQFKKQSMKDNKIPFTRQKFKDWLRERKLFALRQLATLEEEWEYSRKRTTYRTFKTPFQREMEKMDRRILESFTAQPRKMSTWHCPNCGKNYGITCDGKKCTLYEEKQ